MFDRTHKSQYIGGQKEKFVRLEELNSTLSMSSDRGGTRHRYNSGDTFVGSRKKNILKSLGFVMNIGSRGLLRFGESLISSIAHTVIPKKISDKIIFDPQDRSLLFWNRLFVFLCIISLAIDPFFFYVPFLEQNATCVSWDSSLTRTIEKLRYIVDSFYAIRIYFQFRTAYIAPSSRVFGRGELVVDPALISKRYLRKLFFLDLLSVLPLPQLLLARRHQYVENHQQIIIFQFFPRIFRFFPLISELKKSVGVFVESAFAGAAYYLIWYMLCSHMKYVSLLLTSCGVLLPLLDGILQIIGATCERTYHAKEEDRLFRKGVILDKCYPHESNIKFDFGIYKRAIFSEVVYSRELLPKFIYCLWFGLQNLSTLGQGLKTSTREKEIGFSILIGIAGLVLLALLIGKMQTYLASLTVRIEEMRTKRRDSEQWMHHRWLPQDIREQVRRYDHFKWLQTRGVDEENLVQNLPKDLRRDIKRHLCLNLVRRVPLFANMDERLLDAICERLKPSLCTEGTCVLREGDPVNEMLLIIRGTLESITTDGGRSGFYNQGFLKEGDFCGEELLTWALDPKSLTSLPSSTRTVRALDEVEVFALKAEDLKYVASQFRRLHSRQVQHTFRFYSQQWRTWAGCFIQATWRRRKQRKEAAQRLKEEEEEEERLGYKEAGHGELADQPSADSGDAPSRLRATVFASRFATNALRGHHRRRTSVPTSPPRRLINLQKPSEPDFGAN